MRAFISALALLSLHLSACARQTQAPGVRDLEPRPVEAAQDPVNRQAATSVDGLVIAITIDGPSVRLDHVTLARIPRTASQRSSPIKGDQVTVVGFADNTRVSESIVPDAVLNAEEGAGLVRLTKRQVILSLPAPRALDTIEVSAPATGARARLDVRAAYAPYCREYNRDNRYCPSPVQR